MKPKVISAVLAVAAATLMLALEAVWAFHEVQGLKVNGVVGPATARAPSRRPGASIPRPTFAAGSGCR
jgi:hypothetical protein